MTRMLRSVALVATLSFVGAACGDDDADPTPTSGAEDGGTDPTGGGEQGASAALEFTAVDIDFREAEATGAAGELEVTLTNEGAIEHSWVVEGHEADLRLYTQQAGATDEGAITLDAGEYTYYCDIPGHRQAGMEGTLTVE
jgi:plastocyanin